MQTRRAICRFKCLFVPTFALFLHVPLDNATSNSLRKEFRWRQWAFARCWVFPDKFNATERRQCLWAASRLDGECTRWILRSLKAVILTVKRHWCLHWYRLFTEDLVWRVFFFESGIPSIFHRIPVDGYDVFPPDGIAMPKVNVSLTSVGGVHDLLKRFGESANAYTALFHHVHGCQHCSIHCMQYVGAIELCLQNCAEPLLAS